MDWADDITFSVHDLVDFYCAGLIPLEQLSLGAGADDESQERTAFLSEVFDRCEELAGFATELKSAFSGICDLFPLNRLYVGSREQRCGLWQFITVLISRYVEAIRLDEPDVTGRCVRIEKSAEDEIRMLARASDVGVYSHVPSPGRPRPLGSRSAAAPRPGAPPAPAAAAARPPPPPARAPPRARISSSVGEGCASARVCSVSGAGSNISRALPFSLPWYLAKSALEWMGAHTGSTVIAPFVPGVHASGNPVNAT